MKNLYFFIILIIVIMTNQLKAQENENMGYIIKYDLISLLGDQVTNSSGIKLGVEMVYNQSRSIAIDAMYIFPCASCTRAYTTITSASTYGWLLAAEYRYYLVYGKRPLSELHLGPQIFYQHTKSEMRETYDGGLENQYQVYRDLVAAHAMVGYQLRIAGPVYFDPAIGLGLRFISSRNENKKGADSGQHEYPYDKNFESGSEWFSSFNFNIKIGLKL